jgi:putative ATP-grasp target RiPP
MPQTITINDLPAEGPELSDEELAGISGGMRPNSATIGGLPDGPYCDADCGF